MSPSCQELELFGTAGKGWWALRVEERGQAAQVVSHCWQCQQALDLLCPEQGAEHRAGVWGTWGLTEDVGAKPGVGGCHGSFL